MKRLYRTTGPDAMICGVCGGIARYFNVDPTFARARGCCAVGGRRRPVSVGVVIAALIMPKEC